MGRAVLITVRGTVKARLIKVEASPAGFDGRAWVGELRTLREAVKGRKKPKLAIQRILAEHRADRASPSFPPPSPRPRCCARSTGKNALAI